MTEELREWQKPLTEEKIALLVEEFARVKAYVEQIWGTPTKPWQRNGW